MRKKQEAREWGNRGNRRSERRGEAKTFPGWTIKEGSKTEGKRSESGCLARDMCVCVCVCARACVVCVPAFVRICNHL